MNLSRLTFLATVSLAASVMGMPAATVGALTQAGGSHGPFRVRSYIGKCLTYGQTVIDPDPADDPPPMLPSATEIALSGPPVYIDDCITHGGPVDDDVLEPRLQRIVVEEINDRHEVLLRAGDKYIGVTGGLPVIGAPLELQDYTGAPGQIFALDGDSIILVYEVRDDPDGVIVSTRRDLVVEVKNARGANGTPLLLGARDLDDSEFWDFNSVDGSYRAPTNGFVRVPDEKDFFAALEQAHWGSVIQIGPDETIDLTHSDTLTIPSGVTIRGNRRDIQPGPHSVRGTTATVESRTHDGGLASRTSVLLRRSGQSGERQPAHLARGRRQPVPGRQSDGPSRRWRLRRGRP